MTEDPIRSIWKREPEGKEKPMSSMEIAEILRPRADRSLVALRILVWTYVAVALATLVIEGMNLVGYAANRTMLSAHVGVTLVTLGIAAFGVILMGDLGGLAQRDGSLSETVHRQLAFLRGRFEIWLWLSALAAVLLAFALNTFVDNQDGIYRINKPWVFWGTQIAMLLFCFAAGKLASLPVVEELRATAEDVEAQLLEKTAAVDARKPYWRRWILVLMFVLLAALLLGVWVALRRGI